MISQEKLLEHLEPVVFTFCTIAVLGLIEHFYGRHLVDLANRYSPLPFLERLLEPYTTSLAPYYHQSEQAILAWLEAQHRRLTVSANISSHSSSAFSQTEYYLGPLTKPLMALTTPIKPLTTFTNICNSQETSFLLSLPAEIIDLIATYTLTPDQDLSNPYPFSTCYRRPGNLAPSKTSTSILSTCQQIYSTYWYLPWTLSTHTFYLTGPDRCPPTTTSIDQMMRASYTIQTLHPDAPDRRKQVSQIQVFAQLCNIENGYALRRILSIPHFHPRSITITIRHTDWWWWESDHPLHFMSPRFVTSTCTRFPASVTTVTMELESLERKKAQIDWMTNYIARNWHFTRTDDVHLVADSDSESHQVSRWKGAATWGGQRWIRDEDDREPNVLSYYVVCVDFKAVRLADDPKGYKRRYAAAESMSERLEVDERVAEATRVRGNTNCLNVHELERVGIAEDGGGVSASDALRRVMESRGEEHDDNEEDEDDSDEDDNDDDDEDYEDEEDEEEDEDEDEMEED